MRLLQGIFKILSPSTVALCCSWFPGCFLGRLLLGAKLHPSWLDWLQSAADGDQNALQRHSGRHLVDPSQVCVAGLMLRELCEAADCAMQAAVLERQVHSLCQLLEAASKHAPQAASLQARFRTGGACHSRRGLQLIVSSRIDTAV